MKRRGFTLIELLVVITILATLIALLLPAVQSAREAARRMACQSNLRQLSLAVVSYESSNDHYPAGASGNGSFGHSWWVEILPFMEEQALHDQMDRHSPHHGWLLFSYLNSNAVDGVAIETMHCPSSPLSSLERIYSLDVMMPSYVGISGATSHNGFVEHRVSDCCAASLGGEISAGGILIPNGSVAGARVRDGMSNTIVIGEASNHMVDATGYPARVDAGYPLGWISGTRANGTPPHYDLSETAVRPSWNITSIRYPPNMYDYQQEGVYFARGANNPLLSAHPGGVHVTTLDGAVQFLSDSVDLNSLKRMATRDDGLPIESL